MKKILFIIFSLPLVVSGKWNYTFGDSLVDESGYTVIYTSDSCYLIGSINIQDGYEHMVLTKVSEYGEIIWRKSKPKANLPFIYIYDDGSSEKKMIIE